MNEKPRDLTPFKSGLQETDFKSLEDDEKRRKQIFALREDPDVIVRTMEHNLSALDNGKTEILSLAKQEYETLHDRYGIAVSAEYIIGKDDVGEVVLYGITDRVYEIVGAEAEYYQEQEKTLVNVLKYYDDKLQTLNETQRVVDTYLNDIALTRQYVYGYTTKDEIPRYHLVDIDYAHLEQSVDGVVQVIMELCTEGRGLLASQVEWVKRSGKSVESVRHPLVQLLDHLRSVSNKHPDLLGREKVNLLREKLETLFQ